MGRNTILATSVACAVLALGSGDAWAAQLIQNGSFENTANFTDNTGQDTDNLAGGSTAMTDWTVSTPTHGVAWIGPTNPFALTASDGSYFLDLTDYSSGAPYGGVSQTIQTRPGGAYTLTFSLGSSASYGLPDGLTASAGSNSQTFTSTLTNTNNWETETMSFTAVGASTVVSFVGDSGDNYIGLDNVSVVGPSAVPEPAVWLTLLFGVGLAGCGLRVNRQKLASVGRAA